MSFQTPIKFNPFIVVDEDWRNYEFIDYSLLEEKFEANIKRLEDATSNCLVKFGEKDFTRWKGLADIGMFMGYTAEELKRMYIVEWCKYLASKPELLPDTETLIDGEYWMWLYIPNPTVKFSPIRVTQCQPGPAKKPTFNVDDNVLRYLEGEPLPSTSSRDVWNFLEPGQPPNARLPPSRHEFNVPEDDYLRAIKQYFDNPEKGVELFFKNITVPAGCPKPEELQQLVKYSGIANDMGNLQLTSTSKGKSRGSHHKNNHNQAMVRYFPTTMWPQHKEQYQIAAPPQLMLLPARKYRTSESMQKHLKTVTSGKAPSRDLVKRWVNEYFRKFSKPTVVTHICKFCSWKGFAYLFPCKNESAVFLRCGKGNSDQKFAKGKQIVLCFSPCTFVCERLGAGSDETKEDINSRNWVRFDGLGG